MRGMIIGALVGTAVSVGLVFVLNIWELWATVGATWSLIGGFLIGSLFVNLGIWIGGSVDDSY